MIRSLPRVVAVAALLLAVIAMILQFGSLAHLHVGESGFSNAEHDLTLLAGITAHGLPVDAAPSIAPDPLSIALLSYTAAGPDAWLGHAADSRAPPLA